MTLEVNNMALTPLIKKTYTDNQTTIPASNLNAIQDAIIELQQERWKEDKPVGGLYLTTDPTNPGRIWGGTWVLWGSGRVPVCVDADQEEFNAVEKSGGSKNIQRHSHPIPAHGHTGTVGNASTHEGHGTKKVKANSSGSAVYNSASKANHSHGITINDAAATTSGETGSGDAGNLQPYITCYIFKRTA